MRDPTFTRETAAKSDKTAFYRACIHTHTHTHTHNCSSTLERNVLCQDSSHYAKAKLEKHTDGSIQNIFLVWFRGLKPQERNAGTGQECLSHTHPVAAGLMLK